MQPRLPRKFYARDTIDVARDLLGQRLVRRLPDGTRLSGRIVETEAYLGTEDPAAHSFGGRRTERTEVMFGPPGFSYIYFIYGVYFCLNVVTMAQDLPEAVLIRALEPVEGTDWMRRSRNFREDLANGPGRLCQALRLGRAQNNLDLCTSEELWIERDLKPRSDQIIAGSRVGIDYAGDAIHWPLRFGIDQHSELSSRFDEP